MSNQTGPYWIRDDIADRRGQFEVIAYDSVVAIPFPQLLTLRLLVVVARILLGSFDERFASGVVGLSRHDQVEMIRHEAVRNLCKMIFVRGAQNLRTREIDGLPVCEDLAPAICHERKG